MAAGEDKRRSPRIPFEELRTEMMILGRNYPVRISDLSQEGARLVVERDLPVELNQEIQIGVGRISPNVMGRVRWIKREEEDEGQVELGIEFESFMIGQPEEDEIQGLLEAWQDISRSYNHYDAFWHILMLLDLEIVDGKISDLSDAIFSICVWMDQRLGPLNLWLVLPEADGSHSCRLIVERHPEVEGEMAEREAHVAKVAREELSSWFQGQPYIFGGNIVIEYLGKDEAQADLMQRMAVILSRRMQFWSKLLMKNISLQLLGDELERLKQ